MPRSNGARSYSWRPDSFGGGLVFAAYTSFRDFELWNAWFRVWALGVGLGDLKLASIYRRYLKTHDESILPDAEEPMRLFYSQHKGFGELFDAAVGHTISSPAIPGPCRSTAPWPVCRSG